MNVQLPSALTVRSLIAGSIQGVLIHVDGVVRLANQACARLLGYERAEELIGSAILSFVAAEDRPGMTEHIRSRLEGDAVPDRYEFRAIRREGTVIWLECIVTLIAWEGQRAILETVVDITARKQAEHDRLASDEQFRQLAENIKEAFIVMELPSFKALYLNRIWEEIWGRSVEDVLHDPRIWLESIHPDDRAAVRAEQSAIERGEPAASVFRVARPDGSLRWVRARTFPVLDKAGHPYRLVGLVEDVTDIRRTEAQLFQSQKMEAIGQLAGGIAHDFNNLLTVIIGYTEIVLEDLGPHAATANVQRILAAGQSAERLTHQLLAFSRRQILQPQDLDLNDVMNRVESLLRRVIGEDIILQIHLTTPLGRVSADPGQIEQVVLNLAVNARDAMPDGGRLTIQTANVELDQRYVSLHQGASVGPHVRVSVSDTGTGMNETTRSRMFEPFFTTKERGKGTGLGLATVYGIVKQSGGYIFVASEPGKGSTFEIYLPMTGAVADKPLRGEADAQLLSGTETVLLVEDQAETRSVIRETLLRRGYTVIEATNGLEAIEKSRHHSGIIPLVLTDVVMPGMRGRQVAELLRSERPDVRVIYMSGYTEDAIVHDGVLDSGLAFVQKPFTADVLLQKIREVLDAPEAPTP